MKSIDLFKLPQGWMARFVDDAEVMSLFGTDVLPTPFTASASPERVLAAVQAKNPDASVRVLATI